MRFPTLNCSTIAICSLAWLSMSFGAALAKEPVRFNRDIRPLLSDACFSCHGPDSQQREADLRLDDETSAKADRGGTSAVVAGKPDASELIRRITNEDPDLRMPPPESGLRLKPAEIALLRRWVAEGAAYQKHWAFEPVSRPIAPNGASGPNAIDAFVDARLNQAGLEPLGSAEPLTLLRRVSLDLTGLPPTLADADQFLRDVGRNGLDAAFRATVERLFESPRYGEHLAWHWLEAARYADTDGYQNDGPRNMWRWRDWVIDAYNRNLPFDQFTIEQLAGDLLPDATHQQRIATAFNRNHRYNSEEGIPIDEFLLENAVDRVDTTATVWMGLTFGCARCHDHKYDPFSQVEYYQLIDYFNDVAESGRAVKFGNSEPWIKSPTDDQRVRLQELEEKVTSARLALKNADGQLAPAQQAWETNLDLSQPVLNDGLDHYFSFDQDNARVKITQGRPVMRAGRVGKAATVGGAGSFELGRIDGLIGNGRFSIAFWMKPEHVDGGAVLSSEKPNTQRAGILVEFVDGRLRWNINTRWISGVSTIETVRTFEPGEWKHVTLTNDGTQRAAGMTLYVNGQPQEVTVIRNTNSNAAGRAAGGVMRIGYSRHVGFWKGQLDDLRFYTRRTLSPDEATLLSLGKSPSEIVATPADQRTKDERRLLRLAYLEQTSEKAHADLLKTLRQTVSERTDYWDGLPTTMVMEDLPAGRPSHVRIRGVYDQLGAAVRPGVPSVFPDLPDNLPNDRLAFARWLVDPKHPLTARVAVNRYWQMLFGKGLVATPEDFGSQGSPPSHPQLLDWLAAEFMANDWDVRSLLRTIVLSKTYRRSSAVTKEHLRLDPENRLWGRAPRRRLTGNVLRDQALFVSGLLVERRGGPSVYPYQPANLWKEASNFRYKQGRGEDLYRRSLYTYWKRTLAPPSMSLLDAADREWCSVRRKRTNTPLQALALLNDVTFAEAARKLGERLLKIDAKDDAERVATAFRTVATRAPNSAELEVLVGAWNEYRSAFREDPKQAAAIRRIGASPTDDRDDVVELAAATALANVLLNLEEVTTRE